MKKTCISKDWMLYALDSDGYIPVDLPNDYMITRKRQKVPSLLFTLSPQGD